MRIGVDISPLSSKKTGVGNYITYLLLELMTLCPDDTFYLYTFREPPSLFDHFSYANIRVIRRFSISEALWFQTTLAWHLFKDRIDLFWGTTQCIPLFRRRKLKTVLTLYDFAYLVTPATVTIVRRLYLRLLSGYFIKQADRLVTISKGTADRLYTFYNKKPHAVIPPPEINVKKWREGELKEWLKKRGLSYRGYLLILGTKEPRKNLAPTLNVYLSLLKQKQRVYPLVIIGKKGWKDQKIQTYLSCLKKYPQVYELDYLEDEETSKYFSAAHLYLYPSLYEGYGMPVKEARILGTPVLCLDVPEVIEAAQNDAIVLNKKDFPKNLVPYLKKGPPLKKPDHITYPSNRELARELTILFKELC
ncbi:MAG: glycosyltransferase family 4 protein [Chlamydiia bacterium]|nr:glycosyltransferase family 4 protein [Chlamydiia bacterium]